VKIEEKPPERHYHLRKLAQEVFGNAPKNYRKDLLDDLFKELTKIIEENKG